jgi:3-oxoacyl-[acyl-carrier-protein] synthase II
MHRVVVTGLGAVTPVGNNIHDFWTNICKGKSGAANITRFDTSLFKTKFACEVKDLDIDAHIPKSESRKYDLFSQYAIISTDEAVQHAGIDFSVLDRTRIGVIWGSANGGLFTFQDQVSEWAKGNGTPHFNPFFIPKILADMPSGIISIRYGLMGLNFSTMSACATSTNSIIDAFNYIRLGKADMIITGGSEAPITASGVGGFNACKALSMRNDDPATASRPFDITRDGFVMGEGSGTLILESLTHARARGAHIIAEVVGGGMAADAYHLTGTHPNGEGAYLGMKAALEDAGISATDIDYLNAHATSTPLGDKSEIIACGRLFGANNDLYISATKSITGHLLGAAGAIEAIACIKSIETDTIHPTINSKEIEPQVGDRFNLCLGTAVHKSVNYAMSNTFGFGGHIATAIFKKYDEN